MKKIIKILWISLFFLLWINNTFAWYEKKNIIIPDWKYKFYYLENWLFYDTWKSTYSWNSVNKIYNDGNNFYVYWQYNILKYDNELNYIWKYDFWAWSNDYWDIYLYWDYIYWMHYTSNNVMTFVILNKSDLSVYKTQTVSWRYSSLKTNEDLNILKFWSYYIDLENNPFVIKNNSNYSLIYWDYKYSIDWYNLVKTTLNWGIIKNYNFWSSWTIYWLYLYKGVIFLNYWWLKAFDLDLNLLNSFGTWVNEWNNFDFKEKLYIYWDYKTTISVIDVEDWVLTLENINIWQYWYPRSYKKSWGDLYFYQFSNIYYHYSFDTWALTEYTAPSVIRWNYVFEQNCIWELKTEILDYPAPAWIDTTSQLMLSWSIDENNYNYFSDENSLWNDFYITPIDLNKFEYINWEFQAVTNWRFTDPIDFEKDQWIKLYNSEWIDYIWIFWEWETLDFTIYINWELYAPNDEQYWYKFESNKIHDLRGLNLWTTAKISIWRHNTKLSYNFNIKFWPYILQFLETEICYLNTWEKSIEWEVIDDTRRSEITWEIKTEQKEYVEKIQVINLLENKVEYVEFSNDLDEKINFNDLFSTCDIKVKNVDIWIFESILWLWFWPIQVPLTDLELSFYPFKGLECPLKSILYINNDLQNQI